MESIKTNKYCQPKHTELGSAYFERILADIRRCCILYKGHEKLTPLVLEEEYNKCHLGRSIPYAEAEFDSLLDFLVYIKDYITFCGVPSMECEVKPVVPDNLKHIVELLDKDRELIKPGYSVDGKRIFFLPWYKQWEIVKYVLNHPEGVSHEDIETMFIKPYKLDEKPFYIKKCRDLLHFMKHTDISSFKGKVYHSLYLNENKTAHLFMKEDGTFDQSLLDEMNSLIMEFENSTRSDDDK